MPIYEYVCKKEKCKQKEPFEKLVFGRDEEQAVRCPACGGKVKQLLSSHFSIEIHGYSAANGYTKKPE